MTREISFIIRVSDLETALTETVRGLDLVARELCDDFEIMVVDDASPTKLREEALQLNEEMPSVRMISLPFNIGFSSAMKTGLAHSKFDWLMNVPADGTFEPDDVKRFVEQMDKYDLIIGYRPLKKRSLGNKIGISVTRVILRVFFGISVRETNSAKLFNKNLLENTIIESRGIAIGSEMIIKALFRGAKMCHVLLSPTQKAERKTDSRQIINMTVGTLELMLFFVMRTFRLADFDPTGEDKKRVLR